VHKVKTGLKVILHIIQLRVVAVSVNYGNTANVIKEEIY